MGIGAKILGGLVAATTTLTVIGWVAGEEEVKVIRVVDGDTIDVSKDGEEVRVRFLNVNTPELGKNGQPDECLAMDAKKFLESRLPKGTPVRLEYDVVRQDKYGRDLAGVFAQDSLVNAEIAAEGLGVAMQVGENRKFYDQVFEAEQRSRSNPDGIFGVEPGCMTSSLVAKSSYTELEATVAEIEALDDAVVTDATIGLGLAKKVREIAGLAHMENPERSEFQDAAYSDGFTTAVKERVKKTEQEEKKFQETIEKDTQRKEAEQKTQEEKRRLEEEERNKIDRESNARSATVPELRDAPSPVSTVPDAPARVAPAPKPATGGGGYTGCRAYGGNYSLHNVDEKGRPYAKIDCVTKVQIG